MGTLLNRRRYMGGGGAPVPTDYIQNGLVFWLDGIDKGSNEGYWTDLIGGCQYEFGVDGVTSVANGVEYTEQNTLPLTSGTVPDGIDKTIEVVFVKKQGSASPAGVFSVERIAPSGSIAVFINNNRNVFMQRQNCVSENPQLDTLARYSYNVDVACFNESQATFVATDYWSVSSPGVGSGYSNARGLIGTIHSIRIYNRKLSLAEMIANQKYDLVRFGT